MKMNHLQKGCLVFFLTMIACSTSLGAMFTNTVFNTNDTGAGSFRAAIISANARSLADTNLIVFAITNASATGVQTITPATSLNVINRRVIIDGYTQPGASSNTLLNADNAVPLIE